MSTHQRYLEAPYDRASAHEQAVEQVDEDIWNSDTEVSRALAVLCEELPGKLSDELVELVNRWAESIVEDGIR